MQLLDNDEAAAVSAYLAQSAEARRELALIQGDLAIYAYTADMHSPPAQARERLVKQLGREKKAVPIDRAPEVAGRADTIPANGEAREGYGKIRGMGSGAYLTETEDEQPKKTGSAKIFPWIGWAVAAGLAVTTGDFYHEREALRSTVMTQATQLDHVNADAAAARQVLDALTDTSAMRVTLTQKGQAPAVPQGRATYVANKGTLIFIANNLEPLKPSKIYELWLIPAAAGETPIPAGTFRPDDRGNASVIMPPLPKGVEAKAFGVTVEDEGGATTPTLPIILAGT